MVVVVANAGDRNDEIGGLRIILTLPWAIAGYLCLAIVKIGQPCLAYSCTLGRWHTLPKFAGPQRSEEYVKSRLIEESDQASVPYLPTMYLHQEQMITFLLFATGLLAVSVFAKTVEK
jgi:hypothetical protein